MPSPSPNAAPLPALGDLAYQVQTLLPTDSKMSEILLATDRQGQTVVFKIACVHQRGRAETNRRAIHNSVFWLQQMRDHPGLAQLQPICYQGQQSSGITAATFVATLPDWPGAPDFLITEYLAGGTLAAFVGKRPLPVDLALALTYDLAQTLAYLHAHGCVHRDLKPENILFRTPPALDAAPKVNPSELQPVLIDFGIAARVGEAKLISGSRLWMAPELQEAYEKEPAPVDPTWDLYALGLICCYMLSGMRPRRRQYTYQDCIDYRDSVFALLHGEAVQADIAWQELVTALQQLLTRTLARDPKQRPTTAEFADALATLLARMGIPSANHFSAPQPIPSATQAQTQDQLSLDRTISPLPSASSLLPIGYGVHHIQAAGRPAFFRPLVSTLRTFGRWVGIALLALLAFAMLLALFNEPPTDSSATTPVSTPVDLAVVAILSPTASPTSTNSTLEPSATPAPTIPIATTAPSAIPTLARINLTQLAPPPTLVRFTPTPPPTATPLPTQPALTATATPLPPSPTLPPTPTRPLPTATPRPQPTAVPFATIRLRQPAANVVAAQERVEFAWVATGAQVANDHCYELVFWDPAKTLDKRSPIGAGRASSGTVNFSKLRESSDPLLRGLAHSLRGFDWGVRFVSCASPQTILQDVGEARHYTYQP